MTRQAERPYPYATEEHSLSPYRSLDDVNQNNITSNSPYLHPLTYNGNPTHDSRHASKTQREFPSSESLLAGSALGKPCEKKVFHSSDLLAVLVSLVCLVIAILIVADEEISWQLGRNNRQLVALGFLLSIMSLCLSTVAPTLFLRLESRFGRSSLQNYDGILRNSISASHMSFSWRAVLVLMFALPLALSAAYKLFTGGGSTKSISAEAYLKNETYFGVFALPGMQSVAANTGILPFTNATLPLLVDSTPIAGIEPPLPGAPRAYGYNVLLLNNESSAVLDIPQPEYISTAQNLLNEGESWIVTAPVIGTVASMSHLNATDPDAFNSTVFDVCQAALDSSGACGWARLSSYKYVVLIDPVSPGPQDTQYLAILPNEAQLPSLDCTLFAAYAQIFNVTRRSCHGTWVITRGGMELHDGFCDETNALPDEKQQVINGGAYWLPYTYMDAFREFTDAFVVSRNSSDWLVPYWATGVAAMLWSKIAVTYSLASPTDDPWTTAATMTLGTNKTVLDSAAAGLVYPVSDTVVTWVRPTLRKSGLLYAVLAVQPFLVVLVAAAKIVFFFDTPLDDGFGLVSILSGIDADSDLRVLRGAALSGKLSRPVGLVIDAQSASQNGNFQQDSIRYRIEADNWKRRRGGTAGGRRGLMKGVTYH